MRRSSMISAMERIPWRRGGWLLVLGLGLAAAPAAAQDLTAQDLTAEACAQVRETVLPSETEEQWRAIPWRDTLGGAVLEADEQERPVLLWAMNGHPLGCT